MNVLDRKLFNRGARDELRRRGGIMASSEPMMQASGYANGGGVKGITGIPTLASPIFPYVDTRGFVPTNDQIAPPPAVSQIPVQGLPGSAAGELRARQLRRPFDVEPPSYLYVNIPGVTPDPVLMTEQDFERFENLYPDATQATDTTVIDVESLPSQIDISNLSIVTSLDPVGLSRKQAIEKTSQKQQAVKEGIIPEVNIAKSSEDQAEIERLTKEAADAEKKAAALETELAVDSSTPESVALAERRQMLGFPEISPSVRDDAFVAGLDKNFPVGDRAEAPDKPKFPSLDQFIEVQGGRDKREIQKNADEILDDATKDLGGAKTGDAFDDVFDKYVSRFSEILGDDEEEKKKNTGFALAMYGATYAATGDAGQAAMTMIETLRGDAATRQERKDKIKMLALQAGLEEESERRRLDAASAKRLTDYDDAIKLYEAKMRIKQLYDDPEGFLDSADGRAALQIFLSVTGDENLNEEQKLPRLTGPLVQRLLQEFPGLGGYYPIGTDQPKQGQGNGSSWVDE